MKTKKSGYKLSAIFPHKHTKYTHLEYPGVYPTRQHALKAMAKFISNSIIASERYVQRKGVNGPYIVEISKNNEVWHVECVVKKGEFDWKMTKDELIDAEDWQERTGRYS